MKPELIRVVTLNILVDLTKWDQRGQLIVDEVRRLNPDVIAFQEVVLPGNSAQWVADRLEGYKVYTTPNAGMMGENEALAILTHLDVLNLNVLDLLYQNRKAQVFTLMKNYTVFLLANTHLLWQDDPAPGRLEQAQIISAHLDLYPQKTPKIICGDLNSLPGSESVCILKQKFSSAFEKAHGKETPFTFPTPLGRKIYCLGDDKYEIPSTDQTDQLRTIDYLLVSEKVKVLDCQLVFKEPDAKNPEIYASDHYGLMADVSMHPIV